MSDHSQPVAEKQSVTLIERLIEAVTYYQTARGIYYAPAKLELDTAYAAVEAQLDALHLFLKQWNACGPNSDFGRYFSNVRDAALSAAPEAGVVSAGVAPAEDDIIARLRRAYDETGDALLRDAMEAIAKARRAADQRDPNPLEGQPPWPRT